MKYLVSGIIDNALLDAVVRAFAGPVTVSVAPGIQADAAPVEPKGASEPIHALSTAPRKKRAFKRKSNGDSANWPAEGSIYDTVLKSIQGEPKTPLALREVLVTGGFSPGSVNSALGRLEKAGRVRKGPEGWVASPPTG